MEKIPNEYDRLRLPGRKQGLKRAIFDHRNEPNPHLITASVAFSACCFACLFPRFPSFSLPPETEEWLDNEAVCRRLSISKRTLQTLRDTGKISFSMVGHKCYYKESDIMEAMNAQTK